MKKKKQKITGSQRARLARARYKLYSKRRKAALKAWKKREDKIEKQQLKSDKLFQKKGKFSKQEIIMMGLAQLRKEQLELTQKVVYKQEIQIQEMQLTLAKMGVEPLKETQARLHARLEGLTQEGMNPHDNYTTVLELANEFDMTAHDVFHEWLYLGLGGSMIP